MADYIPPGGRGKTPAGCVVAILVLAVAAIFVASLLLFPR